MSVVYKYWDGRIPVRVLHWFELPSGEVGGSGKKNPKRLFVFWVSYYSSAGSSIAPAEIL